MQSNGGLMTARAAGEQSVRTMLVGPRGRRARRRRAGSCRPASTTSSRSTWAARRFDICLAYEGQLRFTKEMRDRLPAGQGADDRHPHARRGWRVDRLDRRRRRAARRAAIRRRPAGPGLRTDAAAPKPPSPTRTSSSAASIPANFLGGEMALDADAAREAVRIASPSRSAWRSEAAAEGHRPRHQRDDGPRHARRLGREGLRPARFRDRRLRRRRPAPRGGPCARARRPERAHPGHAGRHVGPRPARGRPALRRQRHRPRLARRARPRGADRASTRTWSARRSTRWRATASTMATVQLNRTADVRYARQSWELEVSVPTGSPGRDGAGAGALRIPRAPSPSSTATRWSARS